MIRVLFHQRHVLLCRLIKRNCFMAVAYKRIITFVCTTANVPLLRLLMQKEKKQTSPHPRTIWPIEPIVTVLSVLPLSNHY